MLGIAVPAMQAKDLVVYFSAQGHTKAVAERIAEIMDADIYRIEAASPNPCRSWPTRRRRNG